MKDTVLELSLVRLIWNRGRVREAWHVHSWPWISIALWEFWAQWMASDLGKSKCFLLSQVMGSHSPGSWKPGHHVLYPGRSTRGSSFSPRRDFWSLSSCELKGSPESRGVPMMNPICIPRYQGWWDAREGAQQRDHLGLCVKRPT